MGSKGTNTTINVSDMTATYVALKGLADKIRELTGDLSLHKKAIMDMLETGEIDDNAFDSVDATVKEVDKISESIDTTLVDIQRILDFGIQNAETMSKAAKTKAEASTENIKSTGRRFKR
jgi:uncharacterized protein YwgA